MCQSYEAGRFLFLDHGHMAIGNTLTKVASTSLRLGWLLDALDQPRLQGPVLKAAA
jgi:hypothetical protein